MVMNLFIYWNPIGFGSPRTSAQSPGPRKPLFEIWCLADWLWHLENSWADAASYMPTAMSANIIDDNKGNVDWINIRYAIYIVRCTWNFVKIWKRWTDSELVVQFGHILHSQKPSDFDFIWFAFNFLRFIERIAFCPLNFAEDFLDFPVLRMFWFLNFRPLLCSIDLSPSNLGRTALPAPYDRSRWQNVRNQRDSASYLRCRRTESRAQEMDSLLRARDGGDLCGFTQRIWWDDVWGGDRERDAWFAEAVC